NDRLEVYHHIRKDLDIPGLVLSLYPQVRSSGILDRVRDLACDLCSFFGNNFTCQRADYILCEDLSCNAVPEHKLLIEFIASYLCQVITSRIKEHTIDQALRAVNGKRFARTDLFVQL